MARQEASGSASEAPPAAQQTQIEAAERRARIIEHCTDELLASVTKMQRALIQAAEQFEFYAQEHRQKARNSRFNGIEALAVASDEKAATNESKAAMCRAALDPKAKGE